MIAYQFLIKNFNSFLKGLFIKTSRSYKTEVKLPGMTFIIVQTFSGFFQTFSYLGMLGLSNTSNKLGRNKETGLFCHKISIQSFINAVFIHIFP